MPSEDATLAELIKRARDGDGSAAREAAQQLSLSVAASESRPMPKVAIDYLYKALYQISQGADANHALYLERKGTPVAWSDEEKKMAVDIMDQILALPLNRKRKMSVREAAKLALPAIERYLQRSPDDAGAYEAVRQQQLPLTEEIAGKAYSLVTPRRTFEKRSLGAPTLQKWYAEIKRKQSSPKRRPP